MADEEMDAAAAPADDTMPAAPAAEETTAVETGDTAEMPTAEAPAAHDEEPMA
jgi:hypothetical protein